jgi:hypothetical protein
MADTNGSSEKPGLAVEVAPDPRLDAAEQLIQVLREQVEAAAAERKTLGEDVAAARAERSEAAKLRSSAKATLDRANAAEKAVLTATTQATAAANQAKASADSAQKLAASVSTTNDAVKTTLGAVTANANTIAENRAKAVDDAATTAALARKSEGVGARIKKYEEGFDERNKRADLLAERVESLLPGATSAGLAESFLKSRESKNWPRACCLVLFLVSMGMLAWSLFWQLPWQSPMETTTGINWLYLLGRLPIVAIFGTTAWVALVYFRIESRMQDDYRHKQNLAATYDGFRKLMSEEKPNGSPASYDLAQQTLAAIHAPPGRMYDKKGEVYTPAEGVIHSLAERVVELMKKDTTK